MRVPTVVCVFFFRSVFLSTSGVAYPGGFLVARIPPGHDFFLNCDVKRYLAKLVDLDEEGVRIPRKGVPSDGLLENQVASADGAA